MGNVLFDGDVPSVPPPAYGMVSRSYHNKINLRSVHALFAAFENAQFFWLYDEYGMAAFDAPICGIGIEFDGHKKKVIDFGCQAAGMPKEAAKLAGMIDRMASTNKFLTYEDMPPPLVVPSAPSLMEPVKPQPSLPKITIREVTEDH
jgi:hypothetical protein